MYFLLPFPDSNSLLHFRLLYPCLEQHKDNGNCGLWSVRNDFSLLFLASPSFALFQHRQSTGHISFRNSHLLRLEILHGLQSGYLLHGVHPWTVVQGVSFLLWSTSSNLGVPSPASFLFCWLLLLLRGCLLLVFFFFLLCLSINFCPLFNIFPETPPPWLRGSAVLLHTSIGVSWNRLSLKWGSPSPSSQKPLVALHCQHLDFCPKYSNILSTQVFEILS